VKARSTMRNRRRESGIALLIAIFVLLLISVVAISLIVSSGTESALAGNYRSSTGVYYAALAGLEEARGRLVSKNPNSFLKTGPPNFLPPPGTQWDIGYVRYILSPGPADPADTRTAYPDSEYDTEFGNGALNAATAAGQVATTPSVWNVAPLNALPVPGPLYKWVRINAVSEVSLQRQVAPFDGHTPDATKPIYYDGTRLTITSTGAQEALEITSLAVLPNGSQKILQYLVTPNLTVLLPPFPAAITLLGNNVDYTGPLQNSWNVSGNDTTVLGNCAPGPAVWAIGYSNNADASNNNITGSGAVATGPYKNNYTGQGGSKPNVGPIGASIPASFQMPSQLDALAQSIKQIADVVIPGPATGSSLPSGMSNSNLKTVVVQGDLDLTGWHNQGYGLLLVTGNLTYDPDASWYGIVLLIGQGYMTGARNGSGQFVGGVFLAKTRDLSGNLFPDPSLPSAAGPGFTSPDYRSYGSNIQFDPNMASSGTNPGIYYSSCWINAALPTANYSILSFHEISSQ
jgi:hypothetical protein